MANILNVMNIFHVIVNVQIINVAKLSFIKMLITIQWEKYKHVSIAN